MTYQPKHTTAEYMEHAAYLVDKYGEQAQPLLDYFIEKHEREQQPSATDRVKAILGKEVG